MNYEEQIKRAKKQGKGKAISTLLVKWEKAGQKIVGKFLSVNTLESTQGANKTYKQFMFHTTTGYVKAAFGFRGEEYAEQWTPGNIYEIEYLGKVELTEGRRMNDFKVWEFVVAAEDLVGGDDDIPF